MPCPLCGDICRCSSDAHSDASPRWLPDVDARPAAATPHVDLEPLGSETSSLPLTSEASAPSDSNQPAPEDSPAWRQEVAARLNRYQSRRKPRPPRYPSLRLRFEEEEPARAAGISVESPAFQQTMVTASNQALALDGFAETATQAVDVPASNEPEPSAPSMDPPPVPPTAKIIEFPRSWTPPLAPLDELAEPVFDLDRPRILEAPEVVPPPPALGGITIEPAQQPETERRPGIDIPLQSAPLARRILSAAIDGVIIAAACALFGFIFWKMTAIRPPRLQILGLAAGLSGLFWAAYQYLLIVYSGTTPGLRLTGLELARFDGSLAGRRLRRWRVLASFLSAVSLGMGYAWVFLDEDALCWHDRISHTYLAPRQKTAAVKATSS
jgi:uncharacterized RDD family membrane protein YckC